MKMGPLALIVPVNPKIRTNPLLVLRNGLAPKITKTRLAMVTSVIPLTTNVSPVVPLDKVSLSLIVKPNAFLPPTFATPVYGLVIRLLLDTELIRTLVKLVVKTIFTLVPLTPNVFHLKVEVVPLKPNVRLLVSLTTTLLPTLLVTTVELRSPKVTLEVNGMLPSL